MTELQVQIQKLNLAKLEVVFSLELYFHNFQHNVSLVDSEKKIVKKMVQKKKEKRNIMHFLQFHTEFSLKWY